MKHYHISMDGNVDYSYTGTSFAWTLARCAVLMSEDGKIRKPFACECSVMAQ